MTLAAAGNPYTGTSTIQAGVTVTVEPGVKFSEVSFTVKGTLSAEGTAEKPVVFEEDGENAITLEPGSGASVLDHVEMIKAGHEGVYNSSRSAIVVEGSSPTIRNSTFRATGYYAIQVPNGGSPEIANNDFLNGEKTPVYYRATTEQSGEVNIHGNFIEAGENTKYGGGIDVSVTGSTVAAKTLSGNTVIGTPGAGISYTGPKIPTDITENTLTGTKAAVIELSGTVASSATWSGSGAIKATSVTIASGATLAIAPDVHLAETSLTVKGTLSAEGTAEKPVVFEEDGENAITLEPGSGASVLDHVEMIKAGHEGVYNSSRSAIVVEGSSPTIRNSTFRATGYYAIQVPNGGSPEIANNDFLNGEKTPVYYRATTEQSGEVNIHGNFIEAGENTKYGGGIDVSVTGSTVAAKTLSGNTVIGTPGVGLSYTGPDIPGNITENTLSGNKTNVIEVSGTVAHSSTWNDGGTKVKIPSATVAAGVTLKATAGVVLTESKFTVNGTLAAEGTSSKPVVIENTGRSAVIFEPGSGASVLDHVEIINAGHEACCLGSEPAISIKKSSPRITNSTFRAAGYYAIQIPNGGSPEIANDVFLNGEKTPIYYRASAGETGEINIHDNYLEAGANTKYGGGIDIAVSGSTVVANTLSGNTVIGTPGVGLSYTGPDIPGNITENTLVGNKSNIIEVGGTVAHSSTWNDGGSLIEITSVTVASGMTLSIAPNVYLGEANFTISGTLKAEGTSEKPVVFDGTSASAITFESGSGASVLDHVEIIGAGHEGVSNTSRPAISIKKSSPTIAHSVFLNSGYYAIQVPNGGGPEIASDFFLNGEKTPIYYRAATGETGQINIHGNFIEAGENTKYGGGIDVSVTGSTVAAKTLSGNTVIGTPGAGISYTGPDIPGNITENVLVGNSTNIIEVGGTVASSTTWNNANALIKLSSVTVASGVTLKITKGVVMLSPAFTVKGTLNAEGTTAEPVVFTGAKEEASGEWGNIKFELGSGESILDHVEVAYGGSASSSGMVEVKGSHPRITNSTIRKAKYYGIKVTESGTPKIEWNRFRSNTNGLYYSGSGNLSTPNNDWSCASGPKPAGCGDSVTSNVSWKPAADLPELGGHCRGKNGQCGEGADPVSLATGQLNYSHRDILLSNKSRMPLEFSRFYSSGSSADTGLGPGWSQTGLASVTELESGEVLVLRQDGRQDVFYKTEAGYIAPSGVTDKLTKVEGTFRLTTLENTVYTFDSSGRIASITDDHGLKTTYTYNASGLLTTITDPSAQTLTFAYNASNHITSVKDSTGREVKFGYSAAGDLETVTDALGGVTKYAYDSQHRITSITDPRSNVILKNTYDSQGRITEQRDGLENLWKLAYGSGETTVTEPGGGKLTYGFDGQDRVVSETDQLGNKTTTVYDSAGNVSEVIRPGGAKWVFGHDSTGNLTSSKDPEGGEHKYEYDSKNRLTHFTDARGNSWSYEWSAANDLTKITDPGGSETTLTYNESGLPLTETDPDKHKAEVSYDSRGNQLSVTDPLGHKTSFEYNSRNYLISKTAPGLKAESFERNALGDMLSRTTPENHKTKYAYDANGLPTQITDPAEGVWKIAYNAMERPITYTDPLEQQTNIVYNGNLRPTKVTNRRGKETTYVYDLANRLTEIHAPEGGNWSFGYDARGNRTSVTDPRESKTTYEYDLLDRMTKAKEPLSVTTEYDYDARGDLTSITDPRGNTTTYAYDKLGRPTEVAQPLEKTTSFTYDGAGNMLSRANAASTVEYDYDAANRLTEVSSGESTLRSFGYDDANRLIAATDAEGHKIEIGYNEENRVASMNDGRGQSLTRSYDPRGFLTKQVDGRGTLEYSYDKLGRLTSLTDPQGKASTFGYNAEDDLTEVKHPGGITTTNLYDNAGRLSEATTKVGEPPMVLEALKYSYDPAGNLVKRIDSRLEQETSYAYDTLNRLAEFNPPGEGATSYAYDAAGNRTEAGGTTYSYNALNQLTGSSDGTTYGYDAAGRLTTKAKESEETTYTWDSLDHLASVEGPGVTSSYAYDALDRLSERSSEAGTQVFHFGDLGDMATFDANGEGKTTTSYVQGASGLLEQRSGEATSYPLADVHGDITAIANGGGEVTSRQSYDPWGAQLSGPGVEMGYLGSHERRADPATGLMQMGARAYGPALGRFLTEDPVYGHLGIGASVDRYLYVWDNPLNHYDLNGRDVCAPTPWGNACAGDAAEDVGNAADDAWHTGSYIVTHPGEAATNAVNYWAESDSPAAYVFGPLATLGDMGLNPDRVGYYLEKANPGQMAATGLLAAGAVGLGALTVEASADCIAAAPLLGIEAVDTCSYVASTLGAATATSAAGAFVVASK